MNGIVVFALIALVHTVAAAPDGIKVSDYITEKCGVEDAECFKRGSKVFLKKLSEGIPKYNIKPFDTVDHDGIHLAFDGVEFAQFKTLKITGFKDLEVLDYETTKDTDIMKIKVNLVADSTAVVEGEKEHTFPYKVKATITGAASYPKEFKKQKDGKEYVVLGAEKITSCEVEGSPEITIADSDRTAILNDPKLQPLKKYFEENMEETKKKTVACAFFEMGFLTVGQSMRSFLEVVPTEEFYKP